MSKKMYIVKREVIASSVKEALTAKGHVYEITIAEDKYQPLTYKPIGFTKSKRRNTKV